jgi:hypothetical protein
MAKNPTDIDESLYSRQLLDLIELLEYFNSHRLTIKFLNKDMC